MDGRPSYVTLTFRAYPEDGQYAAECLELGVASCADTPGEALDAVVDATELYLQAIEDEGERRRIFAEHGIHVTSSDIDEEVTIPIRPREVVTRRSLPVEAAIA
jgi:predicted RNase H-like HicB family nuclease